MPDDSRTLLIRAFAVAGVVWAVEVVSLFAWHEWNSAFTSDLPWLWRTGQVILAEGKLPATDPFSWTHADKPIIQYQWLFTIAIATVERLAGFPGLFVGFIAAAAAIYLLAPLLGAVPRRVPAVLTIGVAGFCLLIATVNLSLRPMIATSALLLLQYVLVRRFRRGRVSLLAAAGLAVPVYALWANLHTGVVLGIFSLALFAAGDLWELRFGYRFAPADPEIEGQPAPPHAYLIIGAAALIGSLLNPYGFGIYGHLIDLASQSGHKAMIMELQPPDLSIPQFMGLLLLIAGFVLLMFRSARVIPASDALHIAALTIATLFVLRFIPWAALLYALVLPRALHHTWTARPSAQGAVSRTLRRSSAASRLWASLAIVGVLLALVVWQSVSAAQPGSDCRKLQPAIAFYQKVRHETDKLFNSPLVGSCLLLAENHPRVFFDTRFDFYGERFFTEVAQALTVRPQWRSILDKWQIDTIVLERSLPLAQVIEQDPAFQVLYRDDSAIIVRYGHQTISTR
jgi:hypothetical protein